MSNSSTSGTNSLYQASSKGIISPMSQAVSSLLHTRDSYYQSGSGHTYGHYQTAAHSLIHHHQHQAHSQAPTNNSSSIVVLTPQV